MEVGAGGDALRGFEESELFGGESGCDGAGRHGINLHISLGELVPRTGGCFPHPPVLEMWKGPLLAGLEYHAGAGVVSRGKYEVVRLFSRM